MGNVTCRAAAGGGHEAQGQRVAGASIPRATAWARTGAGRGQGTARGRRRAAGWGTEQGRRGFGSRRAVGFWLLGDFFLRARKGLRELCKKGL